MVSSKISALVFCILLGQLMLSHQASLVKRSDRKLNLPFFSNFGNIGNGNVQIITDEDGTETVNDTNFSLNDTNFGNIGNGKVKVISGNVKGPVGIRNNFGNIGNNNLVITKNGGTKSWPWNQGWDWDLD